MTIAAFFCKTLHRLFPTPTNAQCVLNINSDWGTDDDYNFAANSLAVFNDIKAQKTAQKNGSFVKDKIILDAGAGLGGRAVWLAEQDASYVLSLVLRDYCLDDDSSCEVKTKQMLEFVTNYVAEKSYSNKSKIIAADSKDLPLHNASVDAIVLSNSLCCVRDDLAFLQECHRVLKKGGKLFLEFRPWYHPYGAFMQNKINTPWVHKLFAVETIEAVAEQRLLANKMTLDRFENLLTLLPFQIDYFQYEPLRPWLKTMTMLPVFQEYLVNRVVCVLEKATTRS